MGRAVDFTPLSLAQHLQKPHNVMHVAIERLYGFVMGQMELTGTEQSHLVRCRFCIDWLDACAEEKIKQLYFFAKWSLRKTPSTN